MKSQLIRLTQRIQLIQLILLTQQILKVLIQEQTVRCQLIMRLDFGVQKITSKDQTYFAATQKYKTVGATDEVKEGPNYVQVTDNRGTEAGWSLKVKQEGQFKSTSGKELTGAAITFKNGNVVTASDSGKPTGPATITLNSDGSQSDVMSAAKGNGTGTYLFDWGTDATTAAKSIELTVPGSTTKYAEKYATKLTWTLTDAPGN